MKISFETQQDQSSSEESENSRDQMPNLNQIIAAYRDYTSSELISAQPKKSRSTVNQKMSVFNLEKTNILSPKDYLTDECLGANEFYSNDDESFGQASRLKRGSFHSNLSKMGSYRTRFLKRQKDTIVEDIKVRGTMT